MEKTGLKKENVHLHNDKGFTLIEMILSMFIFLTIASMLPLAVKTILADGLLETGIRRMEWEVFGSQVRKEIRSAEELTVLPDRILMKINGKSILYERYGTNLRRRVDYQGHEILIQNISAFQFRRIAEGVELSVKELNGNEITLRFQEFIDTGEVVP